MTGELVLSTRRDPDFFALYRLQRGPFETHVVERGGRLTGMGSILVRSGWLDRKSIVGCFPDLPARA